MILLRNFTNHTGVRNCSHHLSTRKRNYKKCINNGHGDLDLNPSRSVKPSNTDKATRLRESNSKEKLNHISSTSRNNKFFMILRMFM